MRAAIWLVLGALFLAGPARAEALPTFKDCDVCPEMVVVPAGEFIMGTDGGDKREAPAHKVTLKKSYALSETEITFDHWEACRIDGGCKRDPDDHKWGKKGMPVINIDFQDAQDYTAWLSKKTGATYRLPNEAEWEYAAKAGTTTKYWWGDEIGEGNANCRKCGTQWSGKRLGAGRIVQAQSLWPLRHERQRLGMGRRLLEPQSRRRIQRRPHTHHRQLQGADYPGGVLVLFSKTFTRGLPVQERRSRV